MDAEGVGVVVRSSPTGHGTLSRRAPVTFLIHPDMTYNESYAPELIACKFRAGHTLHLAY